MSNPTTLYYIHDPMCSWCWGFRKTWQQVKQQLPTDITLHYLLGGLAPDSEAPMPVALQHTLQQIWQDIQQRIPGTEFNLDFWTKCQPRRSTYPACRAVIAARLQGSEFEEAMILAIQRAYYLQAKNPSNDDTLIELAQQLPAQNTSKTIDLARFATDLNTSTTQSMLEEEILYAQTIGARGFPSLILKQNDSYSLIDIDYNNSEHLLRNISTAIKR